MPEQDTRPPLPRSLRAFALGQPDAPAAEPDYGFGFRYHSQDPKGLGFFGNLQRPDKKGFMGEYSISEDLGDGRLTEIPSMVPTLTRAEVQSILALPEDAPPSRAIRQKAIAFAKQRLAAGLPVFAGTGEQQTSLYPDLPRQPVPPAGPRPPAMMPSHLPGGVPLSQLAYPPESR